MKKSFSCSFQPRIPTLVLVSPPAKCEPWAASDLNDMPSFAWPLLSYYSDMDKWRSRNIITLTLPLICYLNNPMPNYEYQSWQDRTQDTGFESRLVQDFQRNITTNFILFIHNTLYMYTVSESFRYIHRILINYAIDTSFNNYCKLHFNSKKENGTIWKQN